MTADPDRGSGTIWGIALALLLAGLLGWGWMRSRAALRADHVAHAHALLAELGARVARLGHDPAAPGVDVEEQRARLRQLIDRAQAALDAGEPESANAMAAAALRELGDVGK